MKEVGPDVCDEQAPIRTFEGHDIRCRYKKGHSGDHEGFHNETLCRWEPGRHYTNPRFQATSFTQGFSSLIRRVYGA